MSKAEYWVSDDGLGEVYKWASEGLSLAQIAEQMNVHVRTANTWQSKYQAFADAVGAGRMMAAGNVENALYRRAVGYAYTETKTVTDATGEQTVTVTEKQQAPDTLAQIFFLKNRNPKEWRDRREVELEGTVGLVQIVDDIGGADTDPLLG